MWICCTSQSNYVSSSEHRKGSLSLSEYSEMGNSKVFGTRSNYKKTFQVLARLRSSNSSSSFENGRRLRFDSDGNLVEIFLDNCFLETVPVDIGVLVSLENVWLSSNKLSTLPTTVKYLSNVVGIWLNDNAFTRLPPLPLNIETVYLFNNPLSSISGISNYPAITKLSLQECSLTALPDEVSRLKHLRVLECHNNAITELPASLGVLPHLQHLSAHGNKLTTIPKEIGEIQDLSWLSLHFNQITVLPDELGNLLKLKRLSLHWNYLERIPDTLANCKELIIVSLFHNKLIELPEKIWTAWTKCAKLALHANALSHIPKSVSHMTELQEIWLYDNKKTMTLENIPRELLDLPHLTKVHVLENNEMPYEFEMNDNKKIAIV